MIGLGSIAIGFQAPCYVRFRVSDFLSTVGQ